MVNYANGKIYKIESNIGDKIYIGSTTKAQLSMRMSGHRADYKCWKAGKAGLVTAYHLFDEYGIENCKIVLLEDCPCESKDQLSAREAHYIRTLECVNKTIPLRTRAEYRQDNRDDLAEKEKKYREAHRETIREKDKKYYDSHRDEILVQRKAYAAANQAEIAEYQKAYGAANREKITAYQRANRDAINERARARYHAKKAHKI
jgi:hypothetical protein